MLQTSRLLLARDSHVLPWTGHRAAPHESIVTTFYITGVVSGFPFSTKNVTSSFAGFVPSFAAP